MIQLSSMNVTSQEELENRLQSITEHLIQKQNQLEAALSEKAYLQLQIENLQVDLCSLAFVRFIALSRVSWRSEWMKTDTPSLIDWVTDMTARDTTTIDTMTVMHWVRVITEYSLQYTGYNARRHRSIASLVEDNSYSDTAGPLRRRVIQSAHLLDSVR